MKLDASFRAVSFDLDDTFWDCAPAIEHAERRLQQWLLSEAPAAHSLCSAVPLLERRNQVLDQSPELAGDVTVLRKRMLAELFAEADLDPAMAEPAFDVFYRARSEVVLYDGVLELLKALRPRYHVAAITNGNADLDIVGITEHFDLILRASLELAAKPDRAMFGVALKHFGLESAEMVHVGDNVIADVSGAQHAGVGAIWFNQARDAWDGAGPAPDYSVSSIAELHQLLLG